MSLSHHRPAAQPLSLSAHSFGSRPSLPSHITDFRDQVLDLCQSTQTNGLWMLYQGERIGRFGYSTGPITDTASCTKSVVAMAVFKLSDQTRLNIDEPVFKLFSGKLRTLFSQGEYRLVTVRHFLTHTSGLPGSNFFLPEDNRRKIFGDQQFNNHLAPLFNRNIRAAFHALLYPVGKVYDYSNPGVQLLAAVIAGALRRSGDSRTVTQYVQQEIFDPLQLSSTTLGEDGGVTMCNGNMTSTVGDLVRLGECVRNLGQWNGSQILSEAAVREMLSTPGNIEGAQAYYGHLWWRHPHQVFAAEGDLKNVIYVLPYDGITIARTQPWPEGEVWRINEEGKTEFTPEAIAAAAAASRFWNRLLGAPDSLIAQLRQRSPISSHHHLGRI